MVHFRRTKRSRSVPRVPFRLVRNLSVALRATTFQNLDKDSRNRLLQPEDNPKTKPIRAEVPPQGTVVKFAVD
ncbi:MAG: hypothetical protein ABIQ16_26000 [Polyangiaceae bacterium]